jgi:hypothetical protein
MTSLERYPSNAINHKKDGSYLPMSQRLETILRMRRDGSAFAEIAAAVELPRQTCYWLARVADDHAKRVFEDALRYASGPVIGDVLAYHEASFTATVKPFA